MANALPAADPLSQALSALLAVGGTLAQSSDPMAQQIAKSGLDTIAAQIQAAQAQVASLQAQVQAAQAAQPQAGPSVTPQQAAIVSLGTLVVGGVAGWGLTAWLESRKHKKLAAREASESPRAREREDEEAPPARRRRRMR